MIRIEPGPPLSTAEVAAVLGLRQKTVWEYARSGRLKGTQEDSGRWWFDRADVNAYLAAHGVKPS